MSDSVEHPPRTMAPAARLGAELRVRRESFGWALPELSASLRIRQSYLEAIEAGRIGELPGTTYALGFVRAYAAALGLPGEEIASRFRAESAEAIIKPALRFPAPVPQRGVPAGALMLLGIVILLGGYAGWYYVSEHQHTPAETVPPIPDHLLPLTAEKPTPSPQVASILPTTAPPAPRRQTGAAAGMAPAAPMPAVAKPALQVQTTPTPTVGTVGGAVAAPIAAPTPAAVPAAAASKVANVPAGTRILIKATADAWIAVKQEDGHELLNKVMHAGESWPVPPGVAGLKLTTGNAGGTEIDVDGVAIASLGGSGMVRRNIALDPTTLRQDAAGMADVPARARPSSGQAGSGPAKPEAH